MRVRKYIENLSVYKPGKPLEEVQRELGLTNVIKMASNENPFGCSGKVIKNMAECISLNLYPEADAPNLRKKLSDRLGISSDNIIFGNGSDEILHLIAKAYIDPGEETVMADNTFPRYETVTRIAGGVPKKVNLIDGVHDLDEMLRKVINKTKIVWICNPNNPTGTIVSGTELKSFLNKLSNSVLVVLDEAYYEYVVDNSYPESVSLLGSYPNLIILRTFSKIYGLAALRAGYGIGHPMVISELNKVKEPFNFNRIAQSCASIALDDQEFVSYCCEGNLEGIEYITKSLTDMGLTYYIPHGNFILFDTNRPSEDIFEYMLSNGVIIRPGIFLGYPTMIRVTVGTKEQNVRFIYLLKEYFNSRI